MAISTKKGNTLMFLRWWEISIENSGVNFFWFIDNSLEVINAIKCKRYTVSEINTSDFSTLYTSFLLYLVKRNLIGLVEKFFAREKTTFVVVSKNKAFFSDNKYNTCLYWSCEDVCDILRYLLDSFLLSSGLTYINKLLEYQWELIMHLW